jgi:hypothetical protein
LALSKRNRTYFDIIAFVNLNALVQAFAAIAAPLISLATFFSRSTRRRNNIRENLVLVQELDKDEILREHSPAAIWLRTKITIDVAKLAGQQLVNKKPVPKASVYLASVLSLGFGYWTYYLNRNEFVWYSLFPGIAAFLFAVSIYGMFIDREILPEEGADSPSTDNQDDADSKAKV